MPPTMPRPGSTTLPSATIAGAILTPQDRLARKPLGSWGEELIRRLDEARRVIRDTRRFAGELAFVGNGAGLIAAHRGDMGSAWRIMERQIWWHGRMARRSGDAALTAHALQPWVNLGRLESLTGRWREALSRFGGLTAFETAGRLEMGCVRLGGESWSALMASREQFVGFLDSVYVADSLRAMLLNHRFEEVIPFVRRLGTADSSPWIREEACIVADCCMGGFGTALSRARAAAREARGWERVVLRLRAAEVHACAGEVSQAATLLASLAEVVQRVSAGQHANPRLMPVTARLANACHEAGLGREADAVARRVLEGARAARDEMIEIEMLRLLAATAPERERPGWREASEHAEASTDYARYRRGGPSPNPVFGELYERLEDAYAN